MYILLRSLRDSFAWSLTEQNLSLPKLISVREVWCRHFSCLAAVQEVISGIQLQSPPQAIGKAINITLRVQTGSHFKCYVRMGDGNQFVLSAVSLVASSGLIAHHYSSIGQYAISATCQNEISTANATALQYVIEPISGVNFNNTGVLVGQPVRIIIHQTTGSHVHVRMRLTDTTTGSSIFRNHGILSSDGVQPQILLHVNQPGYKVSGKHQ